MMFCTECLKDGVAKNSFTKGCNNFRKSALSDHVQTEDHKSALQTPLHKQNNEKC